MKIRNAIALGFLLLGSSVVAQENISAELLKKMHVVIVLSINSFLII